MNFSPDIIVIGGGWAGFAAALEASSQGHSVTLVEKAPGATALSSGALDIADAYLSVSHFFLEEHLPIEKNMEELIRREKKHPYSLLVNNLGFGVFLDFLRGALQKTTQALPLAWMGDLEKNRLQITSFGNLKPTAMVQESMNDANVIAMNQAKLLIVGIRGYAPFQSQFIKDFLLQIQSEQPVPYIQFAGNLDVDVPGLEGRSSLSELEIAQKLDQEDSFIPFAQSLLSYLQGKVYSHVILPPVMGLLNTELIIRTLKRITGLKVAETLSAQGIIPGLRLRNAIHKACESRGIQIILGEVKNIMKDKTKLQALEIESNGNLIRMNAEAFVLASGKFIGGGIRSNQGLEESIFGIPLNVPFEVNSSLLTESNIFSSQEIWKTGIRTHPLFQPLFSDGINYFENVFAAGSILPGYDYIHGRCGGGVAITTGAYAGKNASAWIKRAL